MVVADEMEPLLAERIRHGENVARHRAMTVVLGLRRPGAGAVTPEVRRQRRVAVRRKVFEHRQPHVRRLRKAMQQDDEVVPVPRPANIVGVVASVHLGLLDRHCG